MHPKCVRLLLLDILRTLNNSPFVQQHCVERVPKASAEVREIIWLAGSTRPILGRHTNRRRDVDSKITGCVRPKIPQLSLRSLRYLRNRQRETVERNLTRPAAQFAQPRPEVIVEGGEARDFPGIRGESQIDNRQVEVSRRKRLWWKQIAHGDRDFH